MKRTIRLDVHMSPTANVWRAPEKRAIKEEGARSKESVEARITGGHRGIWWGGFVKRHGDNTRTHICQRGEVGITLHGWVTSLRQRAKTTTGGGEKVRQKTVEDGIALNPSSDVLGRRPPGGGMNAPTDPYGKQLHSTAKLL